MDFKFYFKEEVRRLILEQTDYSSLVAKSKKLFDVSDFQLHWYDGQDYVLMSSNEDFQYAINHLTKMENDKPISIFVTDSKPAPSPFNSHTMPLHATFPVPPPPPRRPLGIVPGMNFPSNKLHVMHRPPFRRAMHCSPKPSVVLGRSKPDTVDLKPSTEELGAFSDHNKHVHSSVQCDGCMVTGVVGNRYKCLMCPDYDLCKKCFNAGVHSHHIMVVIRKPVTNNQFIFVRKRVEQRKGRQVMFGAKNPRHGLPLATIRADVKLQENSNNEDETNQTNALVNDIKTISSQNSSTEEVVHQNIFCDGCMTNGIRGNRFNCLECNDYDLCEKCFVAGVHRQHAMLILRKDAATNALMYNEMKAKGLTKLDNMSTVNESKSNNASTSENILIPNIMKESKPPGWDMLSETASTNMDLQFGETKNEKYRDVFHSTEDLSSESSSDSDNSDDEIAGVIVNLENENNQNNVDAKFETAICLTKPESTEVVPTDNLTVNTSQEGNSNSEMNAHVGSLLPNLPKDDQKTYLLPFDYSTDGNFTLIEPKAITGMLQPLMRNARHVAQVVGNTVSNQLNMEAPAMPAPATPNANIDPVSEVDENTKKEKLASLVAMGFAQHFSQLRLHSILRDNNYDMNRAIDVCIGELNKN